MTNNTNTASGKTFLVPYWLICTVLFIGGIVYGYYVGLPFIIQNDDGASYMIGAWLPMAVCTISGIVGFHHGDRVMVVTIPEWLHYIFLQLLIWITIGAGCLLVVGFLIWLNSLAGD